MNQRMKEYCDYRDAKILISSWNIDANKPEKFDAQDEQRIREWLTSLRDPDIIVVGIQEIVDLESKKQTASKWVICVWSNHIILFYYYPPLPLRRLS
jgi:hypothetical protein